jgi:hypothetical protein
MRSDTFTPRMRLAVNNVIQARDCADYALSRVWSAQSPVRFFLPKRAEANPSHRTRTEAGFWREAEMDSRRLPEGLARREAARHSTPAAVLATRHSQRVHESAPRRLLRARRKDTIRASLYFTRPHEKAD